MAREFDFTNLSEDGVELEQLVRDLCNALGYRAEWSGKGPDAGRDLFVQEPTSPDFGAFPRKWLVSCKHTAVGGGSVAYSDLGDVPGRLTQHGCQGFLLVTTTQPSAGLMDAFVGWELGTQFVFHYWDAPTLRLLLLREAAAHVVQAYFPEEEAVSEDLAIESQELSEDGMAAYLTLNDGQSFYFQTRKEPEDSGIHLYQIALGLEHLESRLPDFFRTAVRGLWFDDKHSTYLWRIDIASSFDVAPLPEALTDRLSEVLDGQPHDFEFRVVDESQLDPQTPRVEDFDNLQLFAKWPDEPPEDYGV